MKLDKDRKKRLHFWVEKIYLMLKRFSKNGWILMNNDLDIQNLMHYPFISTLKAPSTGYDIV